MAGTVTNARLPVWTQRLPELRGCVGLADGTWGCTETARFLLGTDPYCSDCFVRELKLALGMCRILGSVRAHPVEVSA